MSSASSVASEIERVVRNELDDCERAIKSDNKTRALSEVDDAMRKLKRLADEVRRLGR
ncbi:hypothetical protein X769_28230 [Mesorhizobium sp. LSJC268A00]|uniref:hypothetical protein n=1 Tax=unclassified Mesorhizobium TaxID=325217 RepID=UPI0003CE5D90|nr:hypothetical protein [Mesorhizobium sp. LSJC268A00]ESW95642.1 hypothetical protein X769_28230 [Mesorhizobium sp. LSJC268A00]